MTHLFKYICTFFFLPLVLAGVSFGQATTESVSDYQIKFENGKIHLSSLKHGSLIENNEDFPLIEPVILYEKTKFSRGSIFITPKLKAVGTLSDPKVTNRGADSISYEYKISGKCSGIMTATFNVVSSTSIDIEASLSSEEESKCNALRFSFTNLKDEIFTGIGTQVTNLNLNGKSFMSLSQEQGHGKGKQPITWIGNKLGKGAGGLENFSYSAIPHFLSNQHRSFWIESLEYAHFNFEKKEGTSIITSQPSLKIRINHHLSPKHLIGEFTKKFGVMRPLPDWTHKGAMLGIQGGKAKIDKAIKDLEEHDAKISSVWIQDWVGTRSALFSERLKWNWRLDREAYPTWEKMLKEYGEKDLKVLTYFNPRFITGNECGDPCDFDEGLHNGYFVNNQKGNTYFIGNGGFDFAKLDLTNPEAIIWYQNKIRSHLNMGGVNGWMVDFSESLPFDAKLHSGQSGKEFHNQYIAKWGEINRQVADELVGEDAFLFMRGGVLGSHKDVNAYWLGDQLMSWDKYDGMQSALIGAITSGLSGAAVNHSDIGGMIRISVLGFKITRDRPLFLKWMQMNAFTPIFRTHEGTLPDLVHQFDTDEYTLDQFSYYTNVFALMFDYRKELLKEAQTHGTPLMRGMFLEFPEIERTWVIDDQVMLGPDIIVAPIFNKKQESRSVYLPPGEWIELFTGKELVSEEGQDILVNAAVESIPVYVKKGSDVGGKLLEFVKENPPPVESVK